MGQPCAGGQRRNWQVNIQHLCGYNYSGRDHAQSRLQSGLLGPLARAQAFAGALLAMRIQVPKGRFLRQQIDGG
jgi:hypothetical protein